MRRKLNKCCINPACIRTDALDHLRLRTLIGVKWHQLVCNEKVGRITKQPNLTVIIQSWHLSLFGHIARMDDDADAKMILTAPAENWKRPPGRPRITGLNTVQRDLTAYNLTLNEAVDLAQNRPLWRLMSTYGATHSYWCMPERKNRNIRTWFDLHS